MNANLSDNQKQILNYNNKRLLAEYFNACRFNDVEKLEFLLTHPLMKNRLDIHAQKDLALSRAAEHGSLDALKFLLTSPKLTEKMNVSSRDYGCFRMAVIKGHMEIVDYLLTSPDLTEKADIHARDDWAIIAACQNGHVDIVKYLLTSPKLTEHSNVHIQNDEPFKLIFSDLNFYNKYSQKTAHELIEYFIFEYQIDYTEDIYEFLNYDIEPYITYRKMFETRELKNSLTENLEKETKINIRNKI